MPTLRPQKGSRSDGRKANRKATGKLKPADFPALLSWDECESLTDLQRAALATSPEHLQRRFRRWFIWWNPRAGESLMKRLFLEVRCFVKLRKGKRVKLRKMLDALAYDADKNGLRYPFPHEWTPFIARLLMAWGVAVCIRRSDAEKLPRGWYEAQPRPPELDGVLTNASESGNHFNSLPGFDL